MTTAEKAKHTPGPWSVSTTDRYIRYQGIHGPNICDLEVFGGHRDENEANARLIAAAPEILEALVAIVEAGYLGDDINGKLLAKAEAAIRKARSEQ